MNRDAIETLAATLLRDAGVTTAPVDLNLILLSCDAVVNVDPQMPAGLDGVVMAGWTRHLIRVNGRHQRTRRRFTVAHEIGHLNLHCAEGIGCMLAPGSTYYELQPEREANLFAAYLLMPPQWVATDIADGLVRVPALARRYGVSPQALLTHLRDLAADGVIPGAESAPDF